MNALSQQEITDLLEKELNDPCIDALGVKIGMTAVSKDIPENIRHKLIASFALRIVNIGLKTGLLP